MRAVHIHFYRPLPTDHWLNHVVTRVSPPYSHCDLQFDTGLATSIYQRETVYMENKTFSRTNYDTISLTVSEPEFQRILQYCKDAHARKVGFDLLGMMCSTLPRPMRQPQHVTFCSRYVVEALQQSGRPEFQALEAVLTTPSALHRHLKQLSNQFIHVPEQRLARFFQPLYPPSTGNLHPPHRR